MAYTNNNGQVRIGVRSGITNSPIVQPAFSASLLQSLYGVWNGDTLGTSLDSSIYGVWNGEASNNKTVKNAWNANGNANDSKGILHGVVSKTNGTNGTIATTMTYSVGKVGTNAFQFDGTNFVKLPADTFKFEGDFSVSMWVYIPSSVTSDTRYPNTGVPLLTAFDNMAGYTTLRGWGGLSWYNNKISFDTGGYSYGGSQVTSISGTMSTLNQWVHVVATRKRSSTTSTLYINGSKISQGVITYNPTYNTNNLAIIGGSSYAFSYPWFYGTINGVKIDAVQIWETELDQAAVTELYNSGAGQEYPFTVSNASIPTFNDLIGSNNGTSPAGSVPTFTTGKVGQSFTFDGVNDYIQLPSNSLNFTEDFSISGWVYFPTNYSGSSPMYILSNWNVPSWYTNPNGYFLRTYGNDVTFTIFNNGTSYTVTYPYVFQNSAMPASWHHIAATRKGSSASKLYIDGVLVASNTSTVNPTYLTTTNPTIGAINVPGNVGAYQAINGSKIESLSVWNKTLTDDEITQLYNAGNGTQYPFTSQTLPSSTNQFGVDNGTLMNGCTFTDGKIGKAFLFDGVNDFVLLPTNAMRFTGDFSYSFFVSLGSISGDQTILSCENYLSNENGDRGYVIYFNNGVLKFGGWYNSSILFSSLSTTTVTANTWYHFVVIKTASQVKIYMNGSLQTTTNFTGTLAYNSVVYPAIGVQYKQNNVNNANYSYISAGSKIDALNAWSKALTQEEITELYNSGNGKQLTTTPIVTSGLVLNLDASRTSSYPNSGTTWTDISGNGNNGTLTNGPVFGTASGGQITFDGVNDYVDLGTKSSLAPGTSDFTISFWINPNNWGSLSSTSYSPIFVTLVNGGLWIGKNGPNFVLRTAYIGDDVQYSVLPTVNQWTMVTVNRVGNTAKIYYNTSVVASATVTRNYVSGNSYLSSDVAAGGNYSNIKLSTFNYYNRGLSDSEITQNFNATKTRFGL